MTSHRSLVPILALSLGLFGLQTTCKGGCAPKVSKKKTKARGSVRGGAAAAGKGAPAEGLVIRLEPGQSPNAGGGLAQVAQGTPLSKAETAALLSRLQAVSAKASDVKTFAFRARSLPPPRTGRTIKHAFPPPPRKATAAPKTTAELTVLRHSPDGDVKMAPKLSITFSQPMVAVTSHKDTIAKGVPVTLTPAMKGTWRWIGTRTLLFETQHRFPMATKFTAVVPAGTVSKLGKKLAKEHRWTFATPAPRLISRYPTDGPHPLTPVLFVGFDQKIDPAAVLSTIKLEGDGRTWPLRAATAKEIAADKVAKRWVAAAKVDQRGPRYVAFVTKQVLAPGTSYTVSVGPGTPSAEGPRKTETAQTFGFRTYDPLAIEWTSCTENRRCRPPWGMSVRFNNPLDENRFDPKSIRVSPKLKDQRVTVNGRYLSIFGRTKGMTTYEVTFPAALPDAFGQTLGKVQKRKFYFREAQPRLMSQYGSMTVLDPSGDRTMRVFSINHKQLHVKIWKVQPKDWPVYVEWTRKYRWAKQAPAEPGSLVKEYTLDVKGALDEMVETAIPLKPALNQAGHGQVVVQVAGWPLPDKKYQRQYVHSWIQATDLAVDAMVDNTDLLAWVSRLKDGRSVAKAQVSVLYASVQGSTNDKGLVKLALPTTQPATRAILTAKTKDDVVILPESQYSWGRSYWYRRSPPGKSVRWFVFDDRKLYKPKEEVRLKGWVRLVNMGRENSIELLPAGSSTVTWVVYGPRRNKVAGGESKVNALGGFDLKFKLPDNVNLGYARVRLSLKGPRYGFTTHTFQIQEFKRPEFEVSATASKGPLVVGGHADVAVTAKYYAGGGLPGAKVSWSVGTSVGHFTPAGWSGWTFVGWRPSWRRSRRTIRTVHKTHEGVTDGKGTDRLRIYFDRVDPARPMNVNVSATVQDVSRRTWTAKKTLLVHPSRLYVGLRTKRYFVQRGTPLKVDVAVTDLDGKAVVGKVVAVQAVRQEWRYNKRKWRRVEVDPQDCRLVSKAKGHKNQCTFRTQKGGSYLIRARVTDQDGRPNRTVMTRWVSGGKLPPKRTVEKETVRIIKDRKQYQPGDTASLLVQAPFSPAEGLLTVRRAGIVSKQRFSMKGTTTTLKVPITAQAFPSLTVQVNLVGSAPRLDATGEPDPKLPRRPAYASGTTSLAVPPLQRKLAVKVTPRPDKVAPGGKTVLDLSVRDAAGKAVSGAEVALVAVDEAVLSLTGYKLGSPLSTFYPYRSAGVRDHYLRKFVMLMDPLKLAAKMKRAGPGGMKPSPTMAADTAARPRRGAPPPAPASGRKYAKRRRAKSDKLAEAEKKPQEQAPGPKIRVRKNFTPLAVFAPNVSTDAQGRARVAVKLPDNLTRYRVMAVAVARATHYGYGESNVTAQQPLMLRPQPPRFLNFGDRFFLPVVIQNQSDGDLDVKVAVRGSNVRFTGGQGVRVRIPANDRREVRFAARAAEPGIARFQVAAASTGWADAAEKKLPVWTPATTEAFATYGTVDQGAAIQPVQMPTGVIKEFGGLEVSTSSTALQALTDAVVYLFAYPYECSEQISSRVLSVAALRDVLAAFKARGLPPKEKIEAAVARDLRRLQNMQNDDGGWGFWRRYNRSWPFLSIHVTHALARAKGKGFTVPPAMFSRALNHVKHIERYIPALYGERIRRVIVAYSLYVRQVAGDVDVDKAQALYKKLKSEKSPPLEAIAWIYPVLSGSPKTQTEIAEIRRDLMNRVTETAGAAHFRTSYSDGGHLLLYSNRRIDGLLLEALIKDQPRSDLIPKIVRGLLAHRTKGRWANTQETVWVLLALDKYFNTYEKTTPNFVARLWLGERYAGEHRYAGRTTDRNEAFIPMAMLGEPGKTQNLVLDKRGPGRLYYRIGMRYAPANLRPPPANHGFAVQRRYEAMDDPKDVILLADGTWQVRAGARVRVVVTMVAQARRYHVALVDPLPAGLEPINAALRGSQTTPGKMARVKQRKSRRYGRRGPGRYGRSLRYRYRYWGWWRRAWYEHQNLRDERAEAFTSYLPAGVYTYKYTARAITPGTFVVPPPKAEEMYHPETFGRGPGDRLIVK